MAHRSCRRLASWLGSASKNTQPRCWPADDLPRDNAQSARGSDGSDHRRGATSHVPAIGAAIDRGQTNNEYWKSITGWLPVDPGVARQGAIGRAVPDLQRPRGGLLSRNKPNHLTVQTCSSRPTRGSGAALSRRWRASRARLAHRTIPSVRRIRHHHLEQARCRRRAHCADVTGRTTRRWSPSNSTGFQRRVVSAAHRQPLLDVRRGGPQSDHEFH